MIELVEKTDPQRGRSYLGCRRSLVYTNNFKGGLARTGWTLVALIGLALFASHADIAGADAGHGSGGMKRKDMKAMESAEMQRGMAMGGGAMGHWAAPAKMARRKNPIPRSAASLGRGAKLYQSNCASCHGRQGRGDGPVGKSLSPQPANLARMAGRHTDGDFAWKIATGRGAMPAWKGVLSEAQTWEIVHFIQALKK